jgi:predicted naringenin-chalcone synthase
MNAAILALETAVPNASTTQENYKKAVCDLMQLDHSHSKFLHRITTNSQINQRYSTVKDFSLQETAENFYSKNGNFSNPCTQKRNDLYKVEAPKLAAKACEAALKTWGRTPEAITHLISVSCTGMIAPGIEFLLISKLGLSSTIERLGINFMGCFGAFKGLAIAKALALENPKHRILLVCTELCSLHFQGDLRADTLIANALFADGAAAVIVGCHSQSEETPLFELHHQASEALESTEELMSWEAGNFGYQMRLSAEIPHHLEKHISSFIDRLTHSKFTYDQLIWAVHPGGAAILESIAKACDLERQQMEASWKILNHYGNMSSPTFLFVLKEVLKKESPLAWVIGLGFGPGLSIEGCLMKRVNSHVAK